MPHLELIDRARAVVEARMLADLYVPRAILDATGFELHEMVQGLVPGILMFLAVLGITTAVGTAAGAVLGFLFGGGVGAVPGAAVGAELGFDAGVALLGYLGLGFLVTYIAQALMQGAAVAMDAALIAWHAPDHPTSRNAEVTRAARRFADAVGLIFRGILQGLLQYLLAKGTAAAASRVPELMAQLRRSKFSAAFVAWIERHWGELARNPKLQDSPAGSTGSSTGSGATEPLKTEPVKAEPAAPEPPKPAPKPVPVMATNPAGALKNGRMKYEDVQDLAAAKGLPNKWTSSKKFRRAGTSMSGVTGSTTTARMVTVPIPLPRYRQTRRVDPRPR